jgi:signal transduction histidine kinase
MNPAMPPIVQMMNQETVQSVVHDLRAPMTVLKGYIHMLMSGVVGEMSPEQKQLLERSVGPLEDLILMTDNLLQVVNLENGRLTLDPVATDIDQLLADTIEFYQLPFKQRGMRIYREGSSLATRMRIDPFWIRRVLHNLIWNAFKFTPDNGEVTLRIARTTARDLEITVRDTGRGIPASKLHAVFEKFEQATTSDRKAGSGLGLWISRRVMELHGGHIRVESIEGQGSWFILTFPHALLL